MILDVKRFSKVLKSKIKYRTPVARLMVRQAHAQIKCEAHLFGMGRNLAYLFFCLPFAKNKCAKLGIAITGFLNPKKRGGK
jgi:hypothetical protein